MKQVTFLPKCKFGELLTLEGMVDNSCHLMALGCQSSPYVKALPAERIVFQCPQITSGLHGLSKRLSHSTYVRAFPVTRFGPNKVFIGYYEVMPSVRQYFLFPSN